jgi:hypothetical protein
VQDYGHKLSAVRLCQAPTSFALRPSGLRPYAKLMYCNKSRIIDNHIIYSLIFVFIDESRRCAEKRGTQELRDRRRDRIRRPGNVRRSKGAREASNGKVRERREEYCFTRDLID